jgi:vancomycin permeability regulator SanA
MDVLFWLRFGLLLGAGLFTGTALVIAIDGWAARPAPADVAIVLGNRVEPTGAPSKRLRARLEAARELYARGLVSHLLVSGGTGVEGIDEAAAMRGYLIGRGVPGDRVLADPEGANTFLTARNACRIMEERGFGTALVVSQFFHLTRARLACARAGIRVTGAWAARFTEPRDLPSLAREVVGLYAYALGFRASFG